MTMLPPPQYDHPPQIPVIERVLSFEEIQIVCNARAYLDEHNINPASGVGLLGCSKRGVKWDATNQKFVVGDGCIAVYIDNPEVRRHELAHCNGWPGDHPGGYYEFRAR